MTTSGADESIVIVSGGDDAFAMPIAVTLFSALANLRTTLKPLVYIFDDGVSATHKQRIEQVLGRAHAGVRVVWLKPDLDAIEGLSASPWNTRATYMRLFIPAMIPAEHKRVIYIDSDVIVEANLAQIWEQDLEGRLALAVENYVDPTVARGLSGTYQDLGLDPDTPYFNAGILVINTERWRRERVPARVIEFLHTYGPRAPFADQDGLNAIIAGDWGKLHPRWNVQLLIIEAFGQGFMGAEERGRAQAELLAHPAILHYTGPRKPWNLRYRGPAGEAFGRYLGLSGWLDPMSYGAWAVSHSLSHLGTRQLGLVKDRLKGGRHERAPVSSPR